MNKKAFIGATLVTATVVGGVVYFRHKILEQVDKWLDNGEQVNRMLNMEERPADILPEALDLTPEERDQFLATLKERRS